MCKGRPVALYSDWPCHASHPHHNGTTRWNHSEPEDIEVLAASAECVKQETASGQSLHRMFDHPAIPGTDLANSIRYKFISN